MCLELAFGSLHCLCLISIIHFRSTIHIRSSISDYPSEAITVIELLNICWILEIISFGGNDCCRIANYMLDTCWILVGSVLDTCSILVGTSSRSGEVGWEVSREIILVGYLFDLCRRLLEIWGGRLSVISRDNTCWILVRSL